jgi:DNA-binding response OmpR family regulator
MVRSKLGEVKSRLVDVYVKRIRRKIEVDEENPKYLRTVRGLGIAFTFRMRRQGFLRVEVR